MKLFSNNGFDEGRWAGGLAQLLREKRIIPELSPKARVWRAQWKQWIQFEQKGLFGPIFSIGKPGIISNDNSLYIGYYIERGFSYKSGKPIEQIITPEWHWNGFKKCLDNEGHRQSLKSLIVELPMDRSGIWIRTDKTNKFLKYKNQHIFLAAQSEIAALPTDLWIDVVLGITFSKAECLELQSALVPLIVTATIKADEISSLVKDAMDK